MPKKVLIVDDETDLCDMLCMTLMAKGFEADSAENGQVGFDKARSTQPDIILLDLMMPVMNGYEAAKALKGDPATRDIPIIVVTGKADADLATQVEALGACDLLRKPFDPNDLIDLIKATIGN